MARLHNTCITTRRHSKVLSGTRRHTVSAAQRPDLRVLLAPTRRRSGVRVPQRPPRVPSTVASSAIERRRSDRAGVPADSVVATHIQDASACPRLREGAMSEPQTLRWPWAVWASMLCLVAAALTLSLANGTFDTFVAIAVPMMVGYGTIGAFVASRVRGNPTRLVDAHGRPELRRDRHQQRIPRVGRPQRRAAPGPLRLALELGLRR